MSHEPPASTEPPPRQLRALLAEDDDRLRELLALRLRRARFDVVEATNGADLLEHIADLVADTGGRPPLDVIVTDIRMPMFSGIDALAELRWIAARVPVIVITAFGDAKTHAEVERLGAAAVFDKPFDLDTLVGAARQLAGARASVGAGPATPD
jgi:DNA-binding NtrC family response regulator